MSENGEQGQGPEQGAAPTTISQMENGEQLKEKMENEEQLKEKLKTAFGLIQTDPEIKISLQNSVKSVPSDSVEANSKTTVADEAPVQDDDDGDGAPAAADNTAKIAELKAKIANDSISDNERAAAQAEIDKLKLPAAAEGGRRRSKRKQHKKSGKKSRRQSKKGGKKHVKSAKKGKKRSQRKH